MKTIAEVKDQLKLRGPKSTKTKQDLTWSKNPETACVISSGTTLEVYFSEVRSTKIYFEYAGAVRSANLVNAHKYFTGFTKPPSNKTLEKWTFDVSHPKTVTGFGPIEPDGFGPDGSPSWMLALGII